MAISLLTAIFLWSTTFLPDWPPKAIALAGCGILLWRRSTVLSVPVGLLRILTFPALLLCLGLPGIYNHPLYDVGKDIWYFSAPLLYTAFGYLVFERLGTWQRIVQPLLVVGVYECVLTIVHVISTRHELLTTTSIEDYRHIAGIGTFLFIVPTVLLMHMCHAGLPMNGVLRVRAIRVTLYTLSAISVCITFSRTTIACLAAALVCTFSLRATPKRVRNYAAALLIAACVAIAVSGLFHTPKIDALLSAFVDKSAHTSSEVTVHSYETFEDINLNWRGFEAFRAAKAFSDSGDGAKLFGGGFGTMVDLGFAMKLGDTGEFFQQIPLMHNGYMELLVKTGLLGLGLFVAFCVQITFTAVRELQQVGSNAKLNGLLLLWTVFVFLLTQGTIDGILNKSGLAANLFLLGAACASTSLRPHYRPVPNESRTPRYAAYVPSAT